MGRYKHGFTKDGAYPETYAIWSKMKGRCLNSRDVGFPRYGGRGITVCERWLEYTNFLADMGERPPGLTLERVDNDGNYEPGNCKWGTRKEQAINRRSTRFYLLRGERVCLSELAKRHGVKLHTVMARLDRFHMTLEQALGIEPFVKKNGWIKRRHGNMGAKAPPPEAG